MEGVGLQVHLASRVHLSIAIVKAVVAIGQLTFACHAGGCAAGYALANSTSERRPPLLRFFRGAPLAHVAVVLGTAVEALTTNETEPLLHRMTASSQPVTYIFGTINLVRAVISSALAPCHGTQVVLGTRIIVIACPLCRLVSTARVSLARVLSAGIIVFTLQEARGHTRPVEAVVARGAEIIVSTVVIVEGKLTALQGIAAIIRTGIAVIALQHSTPHARPVLADIRGRAQVAVITGSIVEHVEAAQQRVAVVRGARVVVITVGGPVGNTESLAAVVPGSARIAVVALALRCLVLTSRIRRT